MGAKESEMTSLTIVYSTGYADADQRKHQSSALLAFARDSPYKWPVTRKMFPFDDVIMTFNFRMHCVDVRVTRCYIQSSPRLRL